MKIIQIIPAPAGAHLLSVTTCKGVIDANIEPVSCLALIEDVHDDTTIRYPYPLGFGDFLHDLPSVREDVTLHPSEDAAQLYLESYVCPPQV